jgi:hypothetical protein
MKETPPEKNKEKKTSSKEYRGAMEYMQLDWHIFLHWKVVPRPL